jgi:hypothetical protein
MGSSRGFASTLRDKRPIQARFHCGSGCLCLNRATRGNSPDHTPKGTPSPRRWGSDGLGAHDFRVSFTPLAGVLFTVPSRYCALSVAACSLPWTVVSPASARVLRARAYSGAWRRSVDDAYGTVTRYGAAFQRASAIVGGAPAGRQTRVPRPTTPRWQGLAPLTPARFRRGPGSFATTTGVVLSSSGY